MKRLTVDMAAKATGLFDVHRFRQRTKTERESAWHAFRALAKRTLEVERHQRADGETMRTVSETVREANGTLGRIQRILAVSRQVTQPRITGTNCIAMSQAALDAAELRR